MVKKHLQTEFVLKSATWNSFLCCVIWAAFNHGIIAVWMFVAFLASIASLAIVHMFNRDKERKLSSKIAFPVNVRRA